MDTILIINALTLFVAALLIIGILSSLVAARFGAPLLLIFMILGMLVGEDGPGNIPFGDYRLTYLIGSIGLAIILFDGGLRTRFSAFRGVLAPAVLLSTLGVVTTGVATGLAAMWILGLPLLEGLLVGAMVSSTDAAAVFFLLRTGGMQLRARVQSTLEIESGTNDPVAIFLTLMLVELLLAREVGVGVQSLFLLLQQGVIGTAIGVSGGILIALALNRLDLPNGLHPLFVVASALALFALANLLGGSGFLGVYLAGLIVGNRPTRAAASILSFHDTATWLAQIAMFIVLGLLVTPSRLIPFLAPALVIALVLMLVARPLAVVLCLTPFRFTRAEQGFVAWVGLRGAVSIFLAAIPTLNQVPNAEVYFNVVFVVVFVSLAVQGWTVNPLARRLGVALPRVTRPVHRIEIDLPGQLTQEMVGYEVTEASPVLDHAAVPMWARPVFVVRRNKILEPSTAGPLSAGDFAYFLAPPDRVPILDRLFAADMPAGKEATALLLPIRGSVQLGVLGDLYDVGLEAEDRELTVAELFDRTFEEDPSVGDRATIGGLTLVARVVEDNTVSEAAVVLARPGEATAPGEAAEEPPTERPAPGRWAAIRRRLAPWSARASKADGD